MRIMGLDWASVHAKNANIRCLEIRRKFSKQYITWCLFWPDFWAVISQSCFKLAFYRQMNGILGQKPIWRTPQMEDGAEARHKRRPPVQEWVRWGRTGVETGNAGSRRPTPWQKTFCVMERRIEFVYLFVKEIHRGHRHREIGLSATRKVEETKDKRQSKNNGIYLIRGFPRLEALQWMALRNEQNLDIWEYISKVQGK